MSKVHGKVTAVTLNGVDLTAYCNSCEYGRTADNHDVTTFGNNSHRKQGGLLDGTVTIGGFYESVSVTGGPRPIIQPLLGTNVTFVHRPEGTGSGKTQDTVTVLVESYDESSPVADMVTWQASMSFDGDVTTGTQ